MLEPKKAIVRPRVIVQRARDAVLLEDLVAEIISSEDCGRVELYGTPGAGKTTALQHVAFVYGTEAGLSFHDWNRPASSFDCPPSGAIVLPQWWQGTKPGSIKCRLTAWERDEWIEYLLAAHHGQCASIMKRVQNDMTIDRLQGNPNLLRQVFDNLAADELLPDVELALLRIIDRHFPNPNERRAFVPKEYAITPPVAEVDQSSSDTVGFDLSIEQSRLVSVQFVRFLFIVEAAWYDLEQGTSEDRLSGRWPRDLILAVAAKVADAPTIQQKLRNWIDSDRRSLHSLAISLLHAAKVACEGLSGLFCSIAGRVNLDHVILDDANGEGMSLSNCSMQLASFERARLANVNLRNANASNANFSGADLQHAQLHGFTGENGFFVGADLSGAIGNDSKFRNADFEFADLSDTQFSRSDFSCANLSGADLQRASLVGCLLIDASLDEADFRHANLAQANLSELNLTVADFRQANFDSARMDGCDLEGMELPDVEFASASLANAALTDSIMPRAIFADANLSGARLAGVEWESVDLRGADMTGATFHMGSSRSGLVGSSIPSEGSRTGFYTDELNEQDFKAPEEIRKANLRGADLRGAKITNVDFYLVDLRDALYDADQAEQFRRTGAILATRMC